MDPDLAREEIHNLPGSEGWHRRAGEETFQRLFDRLVRVFTPEDALYILEAAYGAVAAEFGA